MHSVRAICSPLYPIRPIWSRCIGAHAHTDTWAQKRTCTHRKCVRSQQHKDCHLQIHSTDWLLKIQAVTFIRRPEPKRFFLQTKGQVCGRADISTSPSLTHSLQRQRLCLVTHGDSVSGSAA